MKERRSSVTPEGEAPARVILLVDDHDGVRSATRRLLEREGFQVLEAGNAEEALRIARSVASIDLLFTDMVMPVLSGSELAARMVRERVVSRVVFYSAYPGMGGWGAPEGLDNWTFLSKPFSRHQLSAALVEVLS